jgi:hypothetical protein
VLSNALHRKEPLLSTPSDQDFTVPDEILRKTAEHTEVSDAENPYILKEQTFRQQYANIYFIRLTKLRDATLEAARERWSGLPGTSPPLEYITRCDRMLTSYNLCRENRVCFKGVGCASWKIMLYYWNRLYGYATQAKYS